MGKRMVFLQEEIMDMLWTRLICYYQFVMQLSSSNLSNPFLHLFLLSAHINNWHNKFHMLPYLQLRTSFQTSGMFLLICSHGVEDKRGLKSLSPFNFHHFQTIAL